MSRKKTSIDNLFSLRLRQLIDKILDIKRDEFSNKIGISTGYLGMIVTGKRGPSAELIAGIYIHYREYLTWLLTGEGVPFKGDVVLEDKTLFLNYRGVPVKEHLQSTHTDLAAVDGENDPRNLKNNPAGKAICNIDTSDPSTPSNSANPPAADPWHNLLDKTRQILCSGTGYANSLAANIDSFYDAVVTKNQLKDHEKRLGELEQKLSTDGREKDDRPVKTAGC